MAGGKHKKATRRLLIAVIALAVIALVVAGLNFFAVQHLLKTAHA